MTFNKMEKRILAFMITLLVLYLAGFTYESVWNLSNCDGEKVEVFKLYSQCLLMAGLAAVGVWFILATRRRRNEVLSRKWKLVRAISSKMALDSVPDRND